MTTMKYSLQEITDIMNAGFVYELDPVVLGVINELARHVGAPDYVKTPAFIKKTKDKEKDKEADWKREKQFKATVIETKTGIDVNIDAIRSMLNKLTDKNYMDMRVKIMSAIEEIYGDPSFGRLCNIIFEIASTNRFYSKMYADFFTELTTKYECFKELFETSFANFAVLFDSVEYCDPKDDYDRFCKNNKDNEKRKALSTFFMNLASNEVIVERDIVGLLHRLLTQLYTLIMVDNKKNEVDELTENIAILYKKGVSSDLRIEGLSIDELVGKLATTNVKDCKSFTNKSKFKYMDIV